MTCLNSLSRGNGPADGLSGRRAVRVHGLDDARAALTAAAGCGRPVLLVGDAAGGAPWFRALVAVARAEVPQADAVALLDCGDRAGDALAALAAGMEAVLFTGPAAVAERLADIAAGSGATLLTTPPG